NPGMDPPAPGAPPRTPGSTARTSAVICDAILTWLATTPIVVNATKSAIDLRARRTPGTPVERAWVSMAGPPDCVGSESYLESALAAEQVSRQRTRLANARIPEVTRSDGPRQFVKGYTVPEKTTRNRARRNRRSRRTGDAVR